MSKYKKGTPQYERQLAADRERKRKKRAEQMAASLDMQTPQEQIEKAPESAMNQPLGDSGFNSKTTLTNQSTHDVCMSESRILDHEDFVRMSRRHA